MVFVVLMVQVILGFHVVQVAQKIQGAQAIQVSNVIHVVRYLYAHHTFYSVTPDVKVNSRFMFFLTAVVKSSLIHTDVPCSRLLAF